MDKNRGFAAPGSDHRLKKIVMDTLRIGDMNFAVELPHGENLNEWLAANTVEFFNEISLIYGCLTEFCTKESCASMSAGPRFEYLWADGKTITKPLKVCASEYIDYLMNWVENQIHNESIFPSTIGVKFPSNFQNTIKTIFKRLFRIYAHIYHSHFHHITALEAEAHLNTSFKHFVYFITEFQLVEDQELTPLEDLIKEFKDRRKNDKRSVLTQTIA